MKEVMVEFASDLVLLQWTTEGESLFYPCAAKLKNLVVPGRI